MENHVRVMVVDDEPAIRHAVEAVLVEEGFEVDTAPNGAVALEALDSARPDAILLDLRMPVMDGYAFLDAHQRRPAPRAPVIVCSTAPDAARLVNKGAAGYLRKPFDIDELIETINRFAPGDIPAQS
jgi:two-component system, chemotaxis family, chemotaxis protein CheY